MSHDTQVRKRLAFEQIHLDTNKRPINHYSFVGGTSSGKGKKFGQPTKRGGILDASRGGGAKIYRFDQSLQDASGG